MFGTGKVFPCYNIVPDEAILPQIVKYIDNGETLLCFESLLRFLILSIDKPNKIVVSLKRKNLTRTLQWVSPLYHFGY